MRRAAGLETPGGSQEGQDFPAGATPWEIYAAKGSATWEGKRGSEAQREGGTCPRSLLEPEGRAGTSAGASCSLCRGDQDGGEVRSGGDGATLASAANWSQPGPSVPLTKGLAAGSYPGPRRRLPQTPSSHLSSDLPLAIVKASPTHDTVSSLSLSSSHRNGPLKPHVLSCLKRLAAPRALGLGVQAGTDQPLSQPPLWPPSNSPSLYREGGHTRVHR